jgi:hypothetical protein
MDQAPHPHHGIDYRGPNLDSLGIFYLSFAAVYSVFVLTGLLALFHLRHTHAVRIRSFLVVCGTVLFLHIYLLLILLVYPLNGLFKSGWEFWIMSILLPLGIALFQGVLRLTGDFRLRLTIIPQLAISASTRTRRSRRTSPRATSWQDTSIGGAGSDLAPFSGCDMLALRSEHMWLSVLVLPYR